MPPKKKKGGKSKTKKKKEIDPSIQLRQDLLENALSLQQEIEQEHILEQQFHKQTELLKGYWEIEKKTRDGKNNQLLEKEHRLRGIADKHTIELNEYKQTIKQLLFANQDELSDKTTRSFMNYRALLADEHTTEIGLLYNELHDMSNRIKETGMSYDKLQLSLKQGSNDEITTLRDEASHRIATLANYSDQQYKETREESKQKLIHDTKDLEGRNEVIIQQVMDKNANTIQQLRTNYSTIMNDNLDKITSLRKDVVLLREQYRHDKRILNDLQTQNDDIIAPLETNKHDLIQLESDLEVHTKQKHDLQLQTSKLRTAEAELKDLEWDHEVLFQKFQSLEVDRDTWMKNVQDSIHTAQQTTNFDNLLLERKLNKLSIHTEEKTAIMASILQQSNVDLDTLDNKSQVCITDVIADKKRQVETLKGKLKEIKDAHATLIASV